MLNDIKDVLIDEKTLKKRVSELGKELAEEYKGKNPLVICVLKGSVLFMSDLVQSMDIPLEIDFMAISSYGTGTRSSGEVRILKDLDKSVEGRDLLIIEDIVDSGLTLSYLIKIFKDRNTNSIKVCSLLDKPERRISEVEIDFVGFAVPDEFVVGYGLDFAEKYRNLPFIGVLKEEVYV
ncbi:hypoxanthine phosphoribosyltransferase [Alkalibacter saccharofermentans]|uniref:Hypoxanthine phosphoribosyltransferase n=1 Tax=Alkalibacter saccharofermentans DSM 14828 TaxID=1120975 RepID=A0A1M4YED9_9FIRM|nr:hypoxanthine phosphoribosyltransferase [Alkalibacter saccharofermentans]SHF04171.1 hypoxanthine phosphoribosyltransferase [Alkalibacter saccharofermentans DSM 14828]